MADSDTLAYSATLDTGNFDAGMEVITGALRRVGEIALDTFIAAGEAVVGFAADSFQSALDAEQAMTRIEQVIQSTGGAAGLTADDVAALGVQFQNLAGGTDDTVIAIEEMALRMGNISKDEMPAFIQTTLDLAAATGQDAVSAARLLAQAQEDPISALGRFRRMGIQFTDAQKEQIKTLTDAGDTAGAFALVMDRVTEATGGAAAAQAGTLAGQWEIFKNTISEAGEAAASALLPTLHEFTDQILPVLVPLVTDLGNRFGAAFAVILDVAIPALQQFASEGQTQFSAFVIAVQPVVDAAGNLVAVFMASMPQIEQTVQNMVTFVQGLIEQFGPTIVANVTTALNQMTTFWQAHGAQIMAIVQITFEFISVTVGVALTLLSAALALAMEAINGDWSGAWETVKTTFVSVMDSILSIVGIDLDSFIETWKGTFDLALQIIQTVWGNIQSAISGAIGGIIGSINGVIGAIQAFIDKILSIPALPDWLSPGSPTPFEMGLRGITSALRDLSQMGLTALVSAPAPAYAMASPSYSTSSLVNYNYAPTYGSAPNQPSRDFATMRALGG
jgi:phage-related protein